MKVVVVDQPAAAVAVSLLLDGMDVVTTDSANAKAVLERGPCDVVLVRWPAGAETARAVVASVRAARSEYTAVIFMGEGRGALAASAFDAGVDDWIERPLDRALLHARVRRAARLASLERTASATPSIRPSIPGPMERLRAWHEFPQTSAQTLSALFGVALTNAADLGDFVPSAASEIRLNATTELLELPVIIEMDERGLGALGRTMFGEELTDAARIDMLLEMGNTLAGTFSRQALAEGTELTIGLPLTLSSDHAGRHLAMTAARRTVLLSNAALGVRLRVHIGVRTRKNVRIPATKLREGMVLAKDLTTPKGVLLARTGTRFSATQAQRVIALLGETDVIEVADAA